MKTGTPKFTGLSIAQIEISFLHPTAKVEGKVGFVDPGSGQTYGWTTFHQWSPATMQKLKELRESMETDAANAFFEEGVTIQHQTSMVTPENDEDGGLGAHLTQDAPSVR